MPQPQRKPRDVERTLDHRRAELARAETTVTEDEAAVETELEAARARVDAVGEALAAFVASVRDAAAARGDVNELTHLYHRVRGALAPTLDLEDHEDRALTVREDAVRARAWVVSSLRLELRHLRGELDYLDRMMDDGRAELADLGARAERPATAPRAVREIDLPEIAPRREQPRVRMDAEIDLHSASNFFAGFSENISDGGLFIATERVVPVGADVDLAFRLPNGIEIRGRGVVRWLRRAGDDESQPAGVGVQFVNLSGTAAEAIERFIQSRDPIFFPG
ncbi:MAG: TIGR02266 family protein [Myxococcales bacterium]|nr:TIGR02266 family protein [Myxococcales bacterium]MCB9732697.1 TIGR02266 family protein [Deltaproteobacteria bacterium]